MRAPGKRRPYDASGRREAAERTRRGILDAALRLFARDGFAATPVAAIAREAGVAVDTVYASIGTKPQLLRLLVEVALSGTSEAVPAQERDYVLAMRAEPDAARKLDLYGAAIGSIAGRLGPVYRVIVGAAGQDPEVAALWRDISERRKRNMHELAGHLAATGQLRGELTRDEVAAVLWSMNAPEFWLLLVGGLSWEPPRLGAWLADAWKRLLLRGTSV